MIKIHKSPEYVRRLNKKIFKENGIIGSRFFSNACGTFVVTKISDKRTNDNHAMYEIIFDKTKSTYYRRKSVILNGEIKDYMYPTVSEIGYLGDKYLNIRNNDPELCEILRVRWKSIIERNYNPNNNNYCNYGKKGVCVDARWYNFSNFYMDIISLENFNRNDFISGNIEIDKDIKQYDLPINKRIYSKDTITLISHKNNMQYVDFNSSADKQSRYFIAENKNGEQFLYKNISEFSRCNHIGKQNICRILNRKLTNRTAGGYKYRYPTNKEMDKINNGIIYPGDKIN